MASAKGTALRREKRGNVRLISLRHSGKARRRTRPHTHSVFAGLPRKVSACSRIARQSAFGLAAIGLRFEHVASWWM